MERRTGKIRGAFSRMHRALDGWMLARAPASPAQGLHHHGPRYFKFLIFVRCVALRNLESLIKTGWNVFVRFIAENAGCGLEKLGIVDQNWLERICPICC